MKSEIEGLSNKKPKIRRTLFPVEKMESFLNKNETVVSPKTSLSDLKQSSLSTNPSETSTDKRVIPERKTKLTTIIEEEIMNEILESHSYSPKQSDDIPNNQSNPD